MSYPALDLPVVWFVLVGILFTGYILLDGFDLGVAPCTCSPARTSTAAS